MMNCATLPNNAKYTPMALKYNQAVKHVLKIVMMKYGISLTGVNSPFQTAKYSKNFEEKGRESYMIKSAAKQDCSRALQ